MSHKNSCGCGCGSNTQVFRGPKGAPGEGATVAVGTVRYGVVPAVTNVGTPTHAVLDFDLPNGNAILYRLRPGFTPGTHLSLTTEHSTDGGETWKADEELDTKVTLQFGKGLEIHQGQPVNGVQYPYELSVKTSELTEFIRTVNHTAPDRSGNVDAPNTLYRVQTMGLSRNAINVTLESSSDGGSTWEHAFDDHAILVEGGRGISISGGINPGRFKETFTISVDDTALPFARTVNNIAPDEQGNIDVPGKLYRMTKNPEYLVDKIRVSLDESSDGGAHWSHPSDTSYIEIEGGEGISILGGTLDPYDHVIKYTLSVRPASLPFVRTVNHIYPDDHGNVDVAGFNIKTVNNIGPDETGNIELPIKTVTDDPDSEGTADTGVAASPEMVKKYVAKHVDHRVVYFGPEPRAEWVYSHSLGYYPHITVLDNRMRVVMADIEYPGPTFVKVTFGSPRTGYLLIS